MLKLTMSPTDDPWRSPQLVLESVSGLDVGLAPPTGTPPAAQVPGVVGPTC